jgi:alpha-tubulin suppressor-like RCC1 family protein
LYTWGIGPLGHKGSSNPIKPKPEKVMGALEYKRVVSVACGREHMACVTDTGELYTWCPIITIIIIIIIIIIIFI